MGSTSLVMEQFRNESTVAAMISYHKLVRLLKEQCMVVSCPEGHLPEWVRQTKNRVGEVEGSWHEGRALCCHP